MGAVYFTPVKLRMRMIIFECSQNAESWQFLERGVISNELPMYWLYIHMYWMVDRELFESLWIAFLLCFVFHWFVFRNLLLVLRGYWNWILVCFCFLWRGFVLFSRNLLVGAYLANNCSLFHKTWFGIPAWSKQSQVHPSPRFFINLYDIGWRLWKL